MVLTRVRRFIPGVTITDLRLSIAKDVAALAHLDIVTCQEVK